MPKRVGKPRTNKGPWKSQAVANRRKAAEERQKAHDKLTPQQLLARLDALGLTAVKERAKLTALINK